MSRKRDISKCQIFENDDPITIRPSQLKLLIRECLEASIEKIRLNESNNEKGSSSTYSKEELENMSAAQLKKLANQKATDEKVTIRVTGRSKIPTKQDNINFLLQETSPDEPVEPPTLEKKKKEAVYDPQRKVYVSGKNATNEKGEVYGRLLKSGKVRPFTPDERAQLSKNKIPLIEKNTQNEVNKYRKACEKKELVSESESSELSCDSSEIISSDRE
ncbi:hypothetical protein DRO61_10275 [Candidatus Bathyarchaeota archaeon]|nr:MAG: hypothetical protein DRO61_10275 [Candidatus Bathyarchaeota archaeon]